MAPFAVQKSPTRWQGQGNALLGSGTLGLLRSLAELDLVALEG
ncbi:MAG: hypothetical protein ACPGYL_01980 [Rhodospirillaceae bacterium]